MQSPKSAPNELRDLLDREYIALMSGDLDRVARMSDARERVMEKLKGANPEDLNDLLEIAARNQRLLAAAARGIKRVSQRLALMREVTTGFQTYDAQGRRAHESTTPTRIWRRA